MVSCSRDVIEIHIRAHNGPGTSLYPGVKGRKVDVIELRVRDIGRIVVAATFCCAVAGKVLEAGENMFDSPR